MSEVKERFLKSKEMLSSFNKTNKLDLFVTHSFFFFFYILSYKVNIPRVMETSNEF